MLLCRKGGIVRAIFRTVFSCGINSSPEVIRLVVVMDVRYPLSLRNVEDLLAERGTDISRVWLTLCGRCADRMGASVRVGVRRRLGHT